jgi:hypothetical protein
LAGGVAAVCVLAALAARFLPGEGRRSAVAIGFCSLGAAAIVLALVTRPAFVPERAVSGRPIEEPSPGYVTSATCRACHPEQHATWHDSYHRKMTQRASPAAVIGDFDGETLERFGKDYRLSRRGDEFWIDMPDPMQQGGA